MNGPVCEPSPQRHGRNSRGASWRSRMAGHRARARQAAAEGRSSLFHGAFYLPGVDGQSRAVSGCHPSVRPPRSSLARMKAITIIGAMAIDGGDGYGPPFVAAVEFCPDQKDRQGLPVGGRQQQREQELVPDEAQGDQRRWRRVRAAPWARTIWEEEIPEPRNVVDERGPSSISSTGSRFEESSRIRPVHDREREGLTTVSASAPLRCRAPSQPLRARSHTPPRLGIEQ